MLQKIKDRLLRFFHDHRRHPVLRAFGRAARALHLAYEHPGYFLCFNGEEGVLRTLRGADLRLALDVGANHGDWCALLLRHHPSARAHLFEVAPPTYAILAQRLSATPGLTLHPHGLGTRDETLRFHYYPSQDGLTSAAWHMHDRPAEILDGRIRRGDAWAEEHGITAADFLKIDVEGMETDVLRGFAGLIAQGAFRFIQFEHHGGRALLHDFYALLPPDRYVIGKIYSRYVAFTPYTQDLEDGIGPNYLAVRTDQTEWLEKLRQGWKN